MQAARSREGSLSCTFCAHEQQRRRGLDLGIVVALFGKPVYEKAAKALQLHDQLMPRQGPLTPRALVFLVGAGGRQGATSTSATCAVQQWSQNEPKSFQSQTYAQSSPPDRLCLGSFRLVICFDPSGASSQSVSDWA